jgi:signal transduction histidine kinase
LFNLLPEDQGRPFWHLTHQLAHSGLNELAMEALKTLKTHEFEVRSESGAWYFARMLPYRTIEGEIDGLVFTFVDITGRKQAEDALRDLNARLEQRVGERTLELERSNRELDQFAYVASHDLKSPLRAITNLANWIREDAAATLPSTSLAHLDKLRSRVARMERLLDDLLTYSRAGRHLHKPQLVDTAELVRGIQFFLELPPGFRVQIEHPMPQLFTERVPLETVLRNLVNNAVKHHDRPREGFVRVSAEEQGDWVQFSVLDNGPGIAPQHHERVFQIFQSLKPRDQVEGSGMGLAVVKKTVESQGGRIELISDTGQGAIFRFTWPKFREDPTS